MSQLRLILAGITGAVGLTGAAFVPSLMKSHGKAESESKAVAKSWPTDTGKDTSFKNFGDAFAPVLLDTKNTSDEVLDDRFKQATGEEGESITDREARISAVKTVCEFFHASQFTSLEAAPAEKMMDLCGIHDSKGKKLVSASPKTQDLKNSSEITAEKVCELLVRDNDVVKGVCEKIGVTNTSAASA